MQYASNIKVLSKRNTIQNRKYITKTKYDMPVLERPCQREIQDKIQNTKPRQNSNTICPKYKGPVNPNSSGNCRQTQGQKTEMNTKTNTTKLYKTQS